MRPARGRQPTPPPSTASRTLLAGLGADIRYAARLLNRQWRHSLLTVATLALGIGATTTFFSLTYGVLLRPLPWPNASRIVTLKEARGGSPPRFGAFSNAAYLAWVEKPATVDDIVAWSGGVRTITDVVDPERVRVVAATPNVFRVLGVRPLLGSFFDRASGSSPVVVLSERLWRRRFDAARSVIGTGISLDRERFTVVGVIASELDFPDRQTDALVPMLVRPAAANYLSMFNALALLRPGVTPAQAAAEGTARGRFAAPTGMTTMAIFGSDGPVGVEAERMQAAMTDDVRPALLVLPAAVGLLLITATANVASLQLARMTARSREMAVRAALGAALSRVARQLLVENLLLGLTGGAAGLALALVLHRALPALLPAEFPRIDGIAVDAPVLLCSLVLSVGTGIACGIVPALYVRRIALRDALADDGTSVGTGRSSPAGRSRALILTGQVAIACLLLVGASLLGRTFIALLQADRGYDATGVLSARVSLPAALYPDAARRFTVIERMLDRLSREPGLTHAAFTSELALTPGGSTSAFQLRTRDRGVVTAQASPRLVSQGYLAALRMHLVAGRGFSDADADSSAPVAVVNHAFATQYLDGSPLAATVPIVAYGPPDDEMREAVVVGVVDDVRYVPSAGQSQPEVFYLYRQMGRQLPVETVTLLVRTAADAGVAAAAVRAAVHDADPQLVVEAVMPLEQRLRATIARPRLYAIIIAAFAGSALAIAAVGLFGLASYVVSLRSRELAIRAAIGADRIAIAGLVLRQALALVLAGIIAGMLASAFAAQALAAQLYGIGTHDAVTFCAVPVLVLIIAGIACLWPARRAATLDVVRVLRGGL